MTGRRPWSLRRTLVLQLVALLAIGAIGVPLLVSGIVERQLRSQSEDQVDGVAARMGQTLSGRDGVVLDTTSFDGIVGPNFFVIGIGPDGDVHTPATLRTDLAAEDVGALLDATTDLDAGDTVRLDVGGMPVVASRTPSPGLIIRTAAGEEVPMASLVVAVDTSRDETIVRRMRALSAGVGVTVLAALAALTAVTVRRGLRPVARMAADARRASDDRAVTFTAGDGPVELHALATALADAFEARRQAEESLRSFVADASHELRGPLTTMSGWLDLYLQGAITSGPEMDRAIDRMERETGRMRRLVDELGLLARLDQGVPLAAAPVDLVPLTRQIVDDALVVDDTRPITLRCVVDAAVVTGDEARLAQVLRNVLGNAVQHTPAGTAVEVTVGIDGADAVVTVADEGPGIADEHVGRLFDRFYRADPARAGEGSGLGLAIVRSLVVAHGGTVGLRTAPGEGATVTIRVPLVR